MEVSADGARKRPAAVPNLTGEDSKALKRQASVLQGSNARGKEMDFAEFYEVETTVSFLREIKATKVALQFPDELLGDSQEVYELLSQEIPEVSFFILADTSYGSCCVDEVAAAHVEADALVHYGDACLSNTGKIPTKYVFSKAPLPTQDILTRITTFAEELKKTRQADNSATSETQRIYIYLHSKYQHTIPDLREGVESVPILKERVRFAEYRPTRQPDTKTKSPKTTYSPTAKDIIIFIGPECPLLTTIMLTFNQAVVHRSGKDTAFRLQGERALSRTLARRFYLMSKAKEANIIGIVIGTMSVGRYLEAIKHLQDTIRKAGKKSYLFLVGKINVPKLSNFSEVDVFVFLACPFQSMVDSTEYFHDIVTPFELELALARGRQWTGEYSTNFHDVLKNGRLETSQAHTSKPLSVDEESGVRYSMVKGKVTKDIARTYTSDGSLVETSQALVTSRDFMLTRTFKGLDASTSHPNHSHPSSIEQGLSGIASAYASEAPGIRNLTLGTQNPNLGTQNPESGTQKAGKMLGKVGESDEKSPGEAEVYRPRGIGVRVSFRPTPRSEPRTKPTVNEHEDEEEGEDEDEEEDDDESEGKKLTLDEKIANIFGGLGT
ncbi:hypothetical protein AAMO2058_000499700 [Amorphochlora amoebiformis]